MSVSANSRENQEPQNGHSGEPGKPAHITVTIKYEFSAQMQHREQHHAVRGVTMQRAQDTGPVPLLRHVFDRLVSPNDAGFEYNEKDDTWELSTGS